MAFGFFRGIWITLRATNYTTGAFTAVLKSIRDLTDAEKELIRVSQGMMQVGMIFIAMGGLVASTITEIISMSSEGKAYMQEFGKAINESLGQIGLEILKIIRPLLEIAAVILKVVASNPILRTMAAIFLLLSAAVLVVGGAVIVLIGGMKFLGVVTLKEVIPTMIEMIGVSNATAVSIYNLARAIGLATAGFTAGLAIVLIVRDVFGKLPAIILGVTLAIIGLTIAIMALKAVGSFGATLAHDIAIFGVALAAGGALGAAIVATQPEYQMGTRMVGKTGPFWGHKGEVIYNPENQLPTQINRDLNRPTSLRQDVTVDLSGSIIQTKADKDELLPMIKRGLRDIVLAKE